MTDARALLLLRIFCTKTYSSRRRRQAISISNFQQPSERRTKVTSNVRYSHNARATHPSRAYRIIYVHPLFTPLRVSFHSNYIEQNCHFTSIGESLGISLVHIFIVYSTWQRTQILAPNIEQFYSHWFFHWFSARMRSMGWDVKINEKSCAFLCWLASPSEMCK